PENSLSKAKYLRLSGKCQFLIADGEIAAVENFGDDVHAVLKLKVDEVRLAVFDFVERRLFASCAPDVRESVVVINRGNQEGLGTGLLVDLVVKFQFACVVRSELADIVRCLCLG